MLKRAIRYTSILIIILISYTIKLSAAPVNDIQITGNNRVSDETIKMFSGISIKDELNLNEINEILKNIYESNFFDNVSVTFDQNILKINVVEKPIIQNIEYKGLKSKKFIDEIYDNRILRPRNSFDENSIKKDRNIILNILKDYGYYFSEVNSSIEILDDNKVNLIFDVVLGDKSKIKKISFIGNKIFKDKD